MKAKKFGGTLAIAWGSNGGLNWMNGWIKRLCFWRVAFYYFPEEIEDTLKRLTENNEVASHNCDVLFRIIKELKPDHPIIKQVEDNRVK
jgi:hypothetical protein